MAYASVRAAVPAVPARMLPTGHGMARLLRCWVTMAIDDVRASRHASLHPCAILNALPRKKRSLVQHVQHDEARNDEDDRDTERDEHGSDRTSRSRRPASSL